MDNNDIISEKIKKIRERLENIELMESLTNTCYNKNNGSIDFSKTFNQLFWRCFTFEFGLDSFSISGRDMYSYSIEFNNFKKMAISISKFKEKKIQIDINPFIINMLFIKYENIDIVTKILLKSLKGV